MKRNIGLLINTQKQKAIDLANRLIKWSKDQNISFLLPPHEASVLGVPSLTDDQWHRSVDFTIVIGGDGTFLRASRYVLDFSIPLYGINVGHLGFLASGNEEKAEQEIRMILEGKHRIEERHVLEGHIWRGKYLKHTIYALNDLVLAKGAFARLIQVEVRVGSTFFAQLPTDGMIVATPTGSTAYSLSAGGPIVPPHVPCIILAPICAHTLYSRPVIFGRNDRISLIPKGDNRDLVLTQDGQLGYEILPSDRIEISLSHEKAIKIIMLQNRDYYDLLQEKLNWGRGITYSDKE